VMTTISDIALKVKVHKSTVSLALRNHPRVSAEMRRKIQAVARQLDYKANSLANALARYRSKTTDHSFGKMAWIDHNFTRQNHSIQVFKEYFAGALHRAKSLGFQIERIPWSELKNFREIKEMLLMRNFEGLILASQPDPQAQLDFPWDQFFIVSIGRAFIHPHTHHVANHQYRSTLTCLAKLEALGYKRIGFVMSEEDIAHSDENYFSAFLAEQQSWPTDSRIPPLTKFQKSDFLRWLETHRPDAVLALDTHILDWLKVARINVPRKIGFVTLCQESLSTRVSGINQRHRQVGQAAVYLLIQLVKNGEKGIPENPLSYLIEGRWSNGKTTRNFKSKSEV
jgi:LacI family transcriptional regulator